jgi:hypothetical protein
MFLVCSVNPDCDDRELLDGFCEVTLSDGRKFHEASGFFCVATVAGLCRSERTRCCRFAIAGLDPPIHDAPGLTWKA